jgi:hypothetical protein
VGVLDTSEIIPEGVDPVPTHLIVTCQPVCGIIVAENTNGEEKVFNVEIMFPSV